MCSSWMGSARSGRLVRNPGCVNTGLCLCHLLPLLLNLLAELGHLHVEPLLSNQFLRPPLHCRDI